MNCNNQRKHESCPYTSTMYMYTQRIIIAVVYTCTCTYSTYRLPFPSEVSEQCPELLSSEWQRISHQTWASELFPHSEACRNSHHHLHHYIVITSCLNVSVACDNQVTDQVASSWWQNMTWFRIALDTPRWSIIYRAGGKYSIDVHVHVHVRGGKEGGREGEKERQKERDRQTDLLINLCTTWSDLMFLWKMQVHTCTCTCKWYWKNIMYQHVLVYTYACLTEYFIRILGWSTEVTDLLNALNTRKCTCKHMCIHTHLSIHHFLQWGI